MTCAIADVRWFIAANCGLPNLSDDEIASMVRAPVDLVIKVRLERLERDQQWQLERDAAIANELRTHKPLVTEARELAKLRGHVGAIGELVTHVVREALADEKYEQRVSERLIAEYRRDWRVAV